MESKDYTLHINYGLCKVMGEVEREVQGKQTQCVKLLGVDNDTVIYVPVDHLKDRTRAFTKPETMVKLINSFLTVPFKFDEESVKRWKRTTRILDCPILEDRFSLLVYLFDVKVKSELKIQKMVNREKDLFLKALNLLSMEISISLGIDHEAAKALLNEKLEARKMRFLSTIN